MLRTIITDSFDETQEIGQHLAPCLVPGDLVALIGILGSGKTTFAQGICEGLGVDDYVNSPTYTIINIYRGRFPVYHFDLFRLNHMTELDELGYEEYFWGGGITLVEWAERAIDYFPDRWIEIQLEHRTLKSRQLTIKTHNITATKRFQPFLVFLDANFSS